ncbi:hypothetical protein PpBr36_00654 [Pyricularia pennisetigena]|uniref:hypothetical protein n=1 Tax=Pyricularia pennisetigena TaxID=1578925 RepID=UPI00114D989C|nr:hypothetical protein PpBr36_00654 [Pyricularia pennisetigena]TLS28498.1 hypothetical protein PpBr36_00654 [Pyricularia pennisetigena]
MQLSKLTAPVIVSLVFLANEVVAWDWCMVTVFYQGRTSGETLPTAKKVGLVHTFPGEGRGYAVYKFSLDHNCKWKQEGRPFLHGMRLETEGFVPKPKYE